MKKELDLVTKLGIFGIVYFLGIGTAMYFCYNQPTDEHVLITNRWLNWPEKDCYTATDLEMVIEGP